MVLMILVHLFGYWLDGLVLLKLVLVAALFDTADPIMYKWVERLGILPVNGVNFFLQHESVWCAL